MTLLPWTPNSIHATANRKTAVHRQCATQERANNTDRAKYSVRILNKTFLACQLKQVGKLGKPC